METKRYTGSSQADKKTIENALRIALKKHPEISFAYIHGSFLQKKDFKDIDIAVYLETIPVSPLKYELKMEAELMKVVRPYPVDVRLLNAAPLSFRYNVIRYGSSLISRDDDKRTDFQENTLSMYFDFAYFHKIYLKEKLGVGV